MAILVKQTGQTAIYNLPVILRLSINSTPCRAFELFALASHLREDFFSRINGGLYVSILVRHGDKTGLKR